MQAERLGGCLPQHESSMRVRYCGLAMYKNTLMTYTGLQALIVLTASLFNLASAADVLQISSLLTSPERYAFQSVRVEGRVSHHRIEQFIQPTMKRQACNQFFTVEDDTGAMDAVYLTLCPTGTPILRDGDRVILDANFERAPGTMGHLTVRSVTKK